MILFVGADGSGCFCRLALTVALLGSGEPELHGLKDITGIERVSSASSSSFALWLCFIFLLAAGAGLGAWMVLRRPRSSRSPAGADVRALKELDLLLVRLSASEQCSVPQAPVELASIARRYVKERFGPAADRKTSEELLAHLLTETGLSAELCERLRWLMEWCDRAKFAQAWHDVQQCRAAANKLREWVTSTATQPDTEHQPRP